MAPHLEIPTRSPIKPVFATPGHLSTPSRQTRVDQDDHRVGRQRRRLAHSDGHLSPGRSSMPPSSWLTAITGQIELSRELAALSPREKGDTPWRGCRLDAPPLGAAGNRQRLDQACRCTLRSGGPADASACPFHLSRRNECLTEFFVAHRKPPTRTQPTSLSQRESVSLVRRGHS
jgi:hypothetical protein